MQHRAVFVVLTLGLASCLRESGPPWLGTCGEYPEGAWEYGQIGIGTCLASPADLRFIQREEGTFLAVSNANAFHDFSGGSVALIDWSSLDLSRERNLTGDLRAAAVELPHLPGAIAEVPERNLLAVPVRYSPDANTRAHDDDLHFIDIADPTAPFAAAVGEGNSTTVTVQADPFPVVYQAESGFLYVGNRSAHTVSVVDAMSNPVVPVDADGRAEIDGTRFFDEDRSGSTAAFAALDISDRTALLDDDWTLRYVEGTWQAWLPDGVGLVRYVSGGGGWTESRYGTELDPADTDGEVQGIADPFYYLASDLGPRMLFADSGSLRGASPGDYLADWAFDADPLLDGRPGAWDQTLGGPFALRDQGVTVLFYDGTSETGASAIGAAASVSGYDSFSRLSEAPLLVAGGAHDAVSQRHPWVFWDQAAQGWVMLYSAWDGARWTIGRAVSDSLDDGWLAAAEPALALDGADCAVPRLMATPRGFTLLYDRREAGGDWQVAEAEAFDAQTWTDLGVVRELPAIAAEGDIPPGLALDLQVQDTFRVEGERTGPTVLHAQAGTTLEAADYGFRLRVVAGEQLELDALGDSSAHGLGVASAVPTLGLAYLEAQDSLGQGAIGVASWDGASLVAQPEPILTAGAAGSFDEDGVSSPVVFEGPDGAWVMLYAGLSGGVARLGRATSPDGLAWEKDPASPVMENGPEWDSYGIWPGSLEPLDGGGFRLWYTGSNGDRSRIGIAESADGEVFAQAREDGGWQFGSGSPGDWDDTSVSDPWLMVFGEARHLWFTGYDGEEHRIGHAVADDDLLVFDRDEDAEGSTIPLLFGELGLFDYGGVRRPVVLHDDAGWSMFYQGLDAAVHRPGLAVGTSPTAFYKAPRGPTSGDRLTFHTEAGHGGVDPIDLDGTVDGFSAVGVGLAALHLDDTRGLLYVASKLVGYLQVIDVRDDSTSGFTDGNYLGIEAILPIEVASGGAGFRGMVTSADGRWLYALNDSPESVMVFDLSRVQDDTWGEVVYDTLVGWLPTPRGYERDEGAATVASVGPGGLALLPDGQTLLVTNFNDNSLGVYDLRMGAWGQLVGETSLLGENPYSIAVSPDGKLAVVACYEGDLDDDTVNSTLAVVDIDPQSDTWLEVLTWIANY